MYQGVAKNAREKVGASEEEKGRFERGGDLRVQSHGRYIVAPANKQK